MLFIIRFQEKIQMPENTNILLIRHAEKPKSRSHHLAVSGRARAQAYVIYFQNFPDKSAPLTLDYLFATENTKSSHRPFLTLKPLSQALGLEIQQPYADKDYGKLAEEILSDSKYDNSNILICWHHGKILELAAALHAPAGSLPSKWNSKAFGWLIHLSYGSNGKFETISIINEQLMYNDYGKDPPHNPK
jgi:hypothetical protein